MKQYARRLVVGDTHGAYLGLEQALLRANYDPAADLLISLGDSFDGYPQASRIIDFYRQLGHDLIYVLGNHDVAFIDWVGTRCRFHQFIDHGAREVLREYATKPEGYALLHRDWLAAQRAYYLDEDNRLFVHAGFEPTLGLGSREQRRGQDYWWSRDFWLGMYEGRNYARDFSEVYLGHTPTTRFAPYLPLPMQRRNVWNVDTGAGFAGCVTVLDVETKAFFQSDPTPLLYPGCQGRN